jgi:hypothetical protein
VLLCQQHAAISFDAPSSCGIYFQDSATPVYVVYYGFMACFIVLVHEYFDSAASVASATSLPYFSSWCPYPPD